jgi:three-Cys-motif partner protein
VEPPVSEHFFDEQTEQSLIKATLVAKYFPAFMRVIGAAQRHYGGDRIAYIDLFAGPGRYKDGAQSTPVKIIEEAIANPDMRQRLVAIFNDKDEQNVRSLEAAVTALPGFDTLGHRPLIFHGEVGDGIVKKFEETKLVPTLSFIDPWGYKGMTLRLINSFLKDWGCDCCFFFNYSRVNMGLANDAVEGHMDALFGKPRADSLRARFADRSYTPEVREAFIVEEMCRALKDMGGKYVLPFRFHSQHGTRTTHHLFFVTKHFRGYSIMKDLMHKHCTGKHEGAVNFEYNPADHRQPTLFGLLTRLNELEGLLLEAFRGQKLTVQQIFERHSVGRPFVLKDYKDVLWQMYAAGTIQGTRAGGKPIKRNTFPEDVMVTFEPAVVAAAN